jgi:hypothetical protein
VARQIVHHYDIALPQDRDDELLDIGAEAAARNLFGRAAALLKRLDGELRACWRPFDDEEIATARVDCCRT